MFITEVARGTSISVYAAPKLTKDSLNLQPMDRLSREGDL